MIKWILSIIILITIHNYGFGKEPIYIDNLPDALAMSESNSQKLLVVFTADWCNACNLMKKELLKNPDAIDNYIVCYVDFDKNPELIQTYKVRLIPDYIIIENKKETKRKIGFTSLSAFKTWIQ